ncbi:MAG: DUF4159 domain-containing protein [Deltaproteobacteria bacterium]|nr:DUF4159 domain-containing protein [Deltaproteobacteria bacterium]MBN2674363.1 DUF4159 domain-containing protein [Deltaproteobacteria bacterium]
MSDIWKANHSRNHRGVSRRSFLAALGAAGVLCKSDLLHALGSASQIDLVQLIYSGGNWQPRPTALRRLAFELQKRTAIDSILEPSSSRPILSKLATSPLLYMAGDRGFAPFAESAVELLRRYLKFGGTLIIDPAYTPDGDSKGFEKSVNQLLKSVLPDQTPEKLLPGHVIFRAFYDLNSAVGKRKGSQGLTGYAIGNRIAVIRGDHDMGGAWAKDNLGNWEFEVSGGARQRENALRLGINLVMYALCGDYKDEMPHKRFAVDQEKRR